MLNLINTLRHKVKGTFNVLAVFSVILAIVRLFISEPLQVLLTTLVSVTVLALAGVAIFRIADWLSSRPGISIYTNWNEAPIKYRAAQTLSYLEGMDGGQLDVIGRTCFRWLCGDESRLNQEGNALEKEEKDLQEKIIRVIRSGCSIRFVLQNPNVSIPYFDKNSNTLLLLHQKRALRSYETIHQQLAGPDQERLQLMFATEVIENSRLRITRRGRVLRLIFDLSSHFKSNRRVSKPFVLVEPGRTDLDQFIKEFNEEFNHIFKDAITKQEFDRQMTVGLEKIDQTVKKYQHHSSLRRDESRLLVPLLAKHYLAENNCSPVHAIPPPVSVQLLVTNHCTTTCKMCDHWKLPKQYGSRPELTDQEICHVLDYIKDMGIHSIIISGGEPLARDGIFEILGYAKNLGLSIGLLTNGVKRGGRSLSAEEAKIIASKCSWIQLSIDSLDRTSSAYQDIRGCDYRDAALGSLRELAQAGMQKIEVCYTIQKDNIREIPHLSDFARSVLPVGIPVRLKFAHGPEDGRSFLCSEAELREAVDTLPLEETRFNSRYLISMLEDEYISYRDLEFGQPLRQRMQFYHLKDYKCHALRLTCKIDAYGDVYPCCFLFDDNISNSLHRNQYMVGSLKPRIGPIRPLQDIGKNPLSAIWNNNELLTRLREKTLPVDEKACNYCTRHFYQNEYLNEVYNTFEAYRLCGLAELLAARNDDTGTSPGTWL